MRMLVTGATGYVGGHLVPRLLDAGHRVRVLVRNPARIERAPWRPLVEVAEGDVLTDGSLSGALAGVDAAYYLIHSLAGAGDFHARDLTAASQFGRAAAEAGVGRIVYLGGLGDPAADLSQHLRSRQETGRALQAGGVPVTELRAAIVVGAGSASFEMIRYLVERLPVMICPRWLYTRVQPISIRDVLDYLTAAATHPGAAGRTIEIGGADVLTYGEMMLAYARARGLRRWLIPVPVLTPRLSAYWVHWVTPIPASIAHPLILGLRNEVVVHDRAARSLFPQIEPLGYDEAVGLTLASLAEGRLVSPWLDQPPPAAVGRPAAETVIREGLVIDRRRRVIGAPATDVFGVISRIGGQTGWYYADWGWALRGFVDRLVGGVGLRHGRSSPNAPRPGDVIDFWRVVDVVPPRMLRLHAEMKLPGSAWLQFDVEAIGAETALLDQTAIFAPKGLAGLCYWYGLLPAHAFIFRGLSREIARRSERAGGVGGVRRAERVDRGSAKG